MSRAQIVTAKGWRRPLANSRVERRVTAGENEICRHIGRSSNCCHLRGGEYVWDVVEYEEVIPA